MSHRPLATVTGLTIGDYLLWNWSLNTNHDVLALVSGLTLPPLTIACVWLLALTAARLIARRSRSRAHARRAPARRAPVKRVRATATASAEQAQSQARVSTSTQTGRRSRKIAA